MRTETPYTLLFDKDCRICSVAAHALHLLDVRRSLEIQPIQDAERLLAAVPAATWFDGAHVVAPDGSVTSGPEAMPSIVAALFAGPGMERRLRRSHTSMTILRGAYGLMTEVRGRLSCAGVAPASAGRIPE